MNILKHRPESESGGSGGGENAVENKPEEQITLSQEQFDEKIDSRLNRQAKKLKEEYSEQRHYLAFQSFKFTRYKTI